MPSVDIVGAIVADLVYCSCILVFWARLANKPTLEYWAGLAVTLLAFPLVYLLWIAIGKGRPTIYYVQLCLMIIYLLVEFMLDYVLKYDFRNTRWMVVAYVTLFFGATGGMIGVAAHAGRAWMVSAIMLFLTMGSLAFYQRAKTGK